MKRTVGAFLTAAAMAGAQVGCQSPGYNGGGCSTCAGPGYAGQPGMPVGPRAGAYMAAKPRTSGGVPKSLLNGDIQQVGYNDGWGAIQNNNYAQKVGTAVPSGMGMGAMMGGMPGMGMPGMGMPGMPPGAACPPGYGGMGGPGMGGMPGMPGAANLPLGPRYVTGRTQVYFVRPVNMSIAWQTGPQGDFGTPQLTTPARYNFLQARIYRLKVTDLYAAEGGPQYPGVELYPTLEVYPGNTQVDAFLAHNPVPIEITEQDIEQVLAGNYVTKVIYLPDPEFQELAIANVRTLISTELDPGVDPVKEAQRKGSLLAVLRIGNIDLEMPHSPELYSAPPMVPMPGMPATPGMPGMPGASTGQQAPSQDAVAGQMPAPGAVATK